MTSSPLPEKSVECGDIIVHPEGFMIVESIKPDGMYVGHKLSRTPAFLLTKRPEIINSDFRYAKEIKHALAQRLKEFNESEYNGKSKELNEIISELEGEKKDA